VVPGAKPAPFPGFVEPRHPTLREHAPFGERWVHETKFDGYRTQAQLRGGQRAVSPISGCCAPLSPRARTACSTTDNLNIPVPRECLHQVPWGAPVRDADSRCWHCQDRGRSANPAHACSGCRLVLATRTDSSASLVASVKIRSADERV
jgi:hypothetical protein